MDIAEAAERILGRSLTQDITLEKGLGRAVTEALARVRVEDDDPDAVATLRRWLAEKKDT